MTDTPLADRDQDVYLGLMSGTSMDGIDAVVTKFGNHRIEVLASFTYPYDESLRTELLEIRANPGTCTIDQAGQLDRQIGHCFAHAALEIAAQANIKPQDIRAIGSHGQTLRHQPDGHNGYTVQVGDPHTIATTTGITTVADFRRRDLALGGQGAPLAPAFHRWLLQIPEVMRVVLNIGGIANISILHKDGLVTGFDTGPGNTLMDNWIKQCTGSAFDENGQWAAGGQVSEQLLQALLNDPYFAKPPPKSTGFDDFNLQWLESIVNKLPEMPRFQDIQATLCEFTAQTIADSIRSYAADAEDIVLCGGGAHNDELIRRISEQLTQHKICKTDKYGLSVDDVEAAAFAWLAMRCLKGETNSAASVTGAKHDTVLGTIFPGTQ